MSLGNTAESDVLKLIFQNVAWANVGDAAGILGSAAPGSLYVSLHTATLTETTTQSTSEAAYNPYVRLAVARSGAGWTISGTAPTQAANAAAITYAQSTNGPETETDFVIGRDAAGAGEALWYGALTAPLTVNALVTPSFAIGACVANID